MTLTRKVDNIQQFDPADARRLVSTEYTAANAAPSTATPTGYFDVTKYLSVTLVVSADDATSDGETVDIVVWRYRRKAEADPLGGAATYYWSKGETLTVTDLGYDEGTKEFNILTNSSERIFYELSSYPVASSWIRCDTYVGLPRANAIPAFTVSPTSTGASTAITGTVSVTNTPNVSVTNTPNVSVTNTPAVTNAVLTDIHDSITHSGRVAEIDPIYNNYVYSTLASVTNGAVVSSPYSYYVDMSSFREVGFQFVVDGGTAPAAAETGITITVEGTLQSDGTAAASCQYVDISSSVFGAASYVVAAGATGTDVWIDDAGKTSVFKYLKVVVTVDTNGDTGDWTIFCNKVY